MMKVLLSTLSALLLVTLVNASPSIPYDGKNVHLNSQYRQRHSDFQNRARHHESLPEQGPIRFFGYGEMKHHHEYPGKLVISMETDKEHVLHHSSQQNHKRNAKWNDAFVMFCIWTLDNLFWLIPFAVHSTWNLLWFVGTYQVLILASCCFITPETTLASADNLNKLYGVSGAIFCWILAYCFYVQFQRRYQQQVVTPSPKNTDIEEATSRKLEEPLIEKPSSRELWSSISTRDTVPQVWLTITMTLVAAVDDVFFVPTIVQSEHLFSVSDTLIASFLAVLLWSVVAVLAARFFQHLLVEIPLYMTISTYAAVMTGHSLWEPLSTALSTGWVMDALRNMNVVSVARKLH